MLKLRLFPSQLAVAKLWVLCLLLCILSGCEECREIDCGPYHQYQFTVFGFEYDEIKNIEVRSFKKGTNYTEPVSEWLITPDNALYTYTHDTDVFLITPIPDKVNFKITSEYDYEFYFPTTKTNRRLSEITDIPSQVEYCTPSLQRSECNNTQISSYLLDGTLHQGGILPFSK